MAKKVNYQTFYPTTFPSLLDAKVGQPTGYVTKDGSWAAVPSNGCLLYTSPSPRD